MKQSTMNSYGYFSTGTSGTASTSMARDGWWSEVSPVEPIVAPVPWFYHYNVDRLGINDEPRRRALGALTDALNLVENLSQYQWLCRVHGSIGRDDLASYDTQIRRARHQVSKAMAQASALVPSCGARLTRVRNMEGS